MESCIDIKVWRQDDLLHIGAERMEDPLEFHAERRDGPLEFRCGLVCTIGGTPYVEVSPDVVWLLPDKSFNAEFVVYSNVTWKIE